MSWLGDFLHRYPDLAVYLAVGLGYLIGGYKVKGFSLGAVPFGHILLTTWGTVIVWLVA